MCPWTSVFTSLSLHCYLYKIGDQSVLTLQDIYERWHEMVQKYLASCLTLLRTQGIIAAVYYNISSHSPWSFVGLLTWPSFIWLACLNWVEKRGIVAIKLGQTSLSRHLSWEYANDLADSHLEDSLSYSPPHREEALSQECGHITTSSPEMRLLETSEVIQFLSGELSALFIKKTKLHLIVF